MVETRDGVSACEIPTDGMPERASRRMRRSYRGRGYGFSIQEEKLARIFDPMFSTRDNKALLLNPPLGRACAAELAEKSNSQIMQETMNLRL